MSDSWNTEASRQVRAWRVLHACESAMDAEHLAEAQINVGMRPQVLAREFWIGANSASPSLMTAWHAVRDWRHVLNEAEALTSVQIVHAHSFAAGMAAVRGSLPSVYDLQQTLDEITGLNGGASAGPWMLRSFRVAEQFALSRASAVVVHSATMKQIACENGATDSNVFVLPSPMAARALVPDPNWAALHGIDLGYHAVIFALPALAGIEIALRAFSALLSEIEHALLVFELGEIDRDHLLRMARDLGVADDIRCISADEHNQATACADLVIVPALGNSRHENVAMLRVMAAGKAVVAADVPENRQCAPDGRGAFWFKDGDVNHLAHQAAFVARNFDLSRSQGENGRLSITENRALDVVGRRYEEVYRHAASRRHDNIAKIAVPKLYTANVQV